VTQYPASKGTLSATQVLTFVDGSEQRCRQWAAPLLRWTIRLNLLDEGEIRQMEEFFLSEQGRYGSFSFVDPWSGTEYTNCSLEADEADAGLWDVARAKASLVVRQNGD